MFKRAIRIALASLATLLILALIGGGVLLLWLRTSLPETSGTVSVTGLSGEAVIARDEHGLVHIRADTTADAYFALGYAHAQDRLWQMEATRLFGTGRLAAVGGATFLPQDRLMRTLGIARLAEAAVARLSPEARAAVDAYSAGVNAFLSGRRGALPPEFTLLMHEPAPWRPADSMIWGRLMALNLSGNWRRQLGRARLESHLGPARAERLFPPYPSDAPVTVPDAARTAQDADFIPSAVAAALAPRLLLDALAAVLPAPPAAATASNSWVVASARSASGKPILANDPHLGLRAPNIWYLARIEAPGLHIAGATAPGVPFHVLGHNGSIAWGMTTTGADTQDLVVERLVPGDAGRYLAPDGPRAFSLREEVIAIRGREPERLRIRETRNGPVVSDLAADAAATAGADAVLVLRSPVLAADDDTGEALFRINRARDWSDFTAALEHFHAPVQSLFYADVAGRVGFSVAGRVPLRGGRDGRRLADGTRAGDDWMGYVPAAELPRLLNPAKGFIANANNRVHGPAYSPALAQDWEEPWRAIRLEELLAAPGRHDPARARDIQLDLASAAARTLLPLLLRLTPGDDGDNARLLDLLRNWDTRLRRDRPEGLIFTAWTARLSDRLFGDELGPVRGEFNRIRPLLLLRVLDHDSAWCDDVATAKRSESCPEILAAALSEARAELTRAQGPDPARWRWGTGHRAVLRNNALDWLPILGPLTRIEVETDGDDFTLNRGTSRTQGGNGRYQHVHGATLRAIYDLADLDGARFAMPGGQSGNPLSPHYRDLTLPWRDGLYLSLPQNPTGALDRLRLVPQRP